MSAIENAIERVIEYHEKNCNGGVNSPCNLSVDARAELAALRDADIRTMEMCGDCGSLMARDYDAPEGETENQMYCPVCRCKGLEQVNGVLRAQVAMLDDYAETIRMHEITIEAQEADIQRARVFLVEWRTTPFFESHDEWEEWARNLAGRVDTWLATYAPADHPALANGHVHLAGHAGGNCVICGLPAPDQKEQ